MCSTALWKLHGVCLNGTVRPRLQDITMELSTGVTAVVGRSGSGKTSLLNMLVEYERPDAGIVERRISESPDQLSFYWVPQEHGLWNHVTVEQHVAAVTNGEGLLHAGEFLKIFGLDDHRGRFPNQMSVGQRSRLAVARALATNAVVLVMDEPFTHVDRERAEVYWRRVISHVKQSNASLIYATHSPSMVIGFAKHVAVIQEGKLAYSGEVDALYWNPPNRELAFSLGPANWFTASEAPLWLGDTLGQDCCLRPERIRVERDSKSQIRILNHHAGGMLRTLDVVHDQTRQEKTLYVMAVGPEIFAGDTIRLTTAEPGKHLGGKAR